MPTANSRASTTSGWSRVAVRPSSEIRSTPFDVLDGQSGSGQQVGVGLDDLDDVELRDAVDLAVEGDLAQGRLAEHTGVDALALDAVGQRDDRAAGGERADLVSVGVDDLRRFTRGDAGEELLDVEVTLYQVDLDVAERGLGLVHAHAADLVVGTEPHDGERAAQLGVGVVGDVGRLVAAGALGAAGDEQAGEQE
jgi:hypothetical protein